MNREARTSMNGCVGDSVAVNVVMRHCPVNSGGGFHDIGEADTHWFAQILHKTTYNKITHQAEENTLHTYHTFGSKIVMSSSITLTCSIRSEGSGSFND